MLHPTFMKFISSTFSLTANSCCSHLCFFEAIAIMISKSNLKHCTKKLGLIKWNSYGWKNANLQFHNYFWQVPASVSIKQWRRHDFFGGTLRPLKGYHVPPQVVRGGRPPPTVANFHFLKRCKVLENESIFKYFFIFVAKKEFV